MVGVATFVLGTTHADAASVVVEPPLSQLTVSTAPAGYAVTTDPSALSGEFTLDQLAAATGETIDPEMSRQAAGFTAYARTFDAVDGSRVVVLLVRVPSTSDAGEFLRGVVEGSGGQSYETGLEDTLGLIVDGPTPIRVVAWHQGRYAVQVISAASTAIAAESTARQTAAAQIELLRALAGNPSASTSDGADAAYLLGAIGGSAVVGALIIYRIVRNRRLKPAPVVLQPWMTEMDRHRRHAPPPPHIPWQQGPPPPPAPPLG